MLLQSYMSKDNILKVVHVEFHVQEMTLIFVFYGERVRGDASPRWHFHSKSAQTSNPPGFGRFWIKSIAMQKGFPICLMPHDIEDLERILYFLAEK